MLIRKPTKILLSFDKLYRWYTNLVVEVHKKCLCFRYVYVLYCDGTYLFYKSTNYENVKRFRFQEKDCKLNLLGTLEIKKAINTDKLVVNNHKEFYIGVFPLLFSNL